MCAIETLKRLTLLLIGVLVCAPADAREVHLKYTAYWGGLHVADFTLSLADLSQPDSAMTATGFQLETRGLTHWLIGLDLDGTSRGRVNDTAPFLTPTGYEIDVKTHHRDRVLKVDYSQPRARTFIHDRKQNGKTFEAGQEKDHFAEADIPARELENVMDPILGLEEALRRTRAALEGKAPKTFRLRGFDGKRRFDMDGEVLGRASRTIAEKKHDTYRLRLTARPVAGFKKRHRLLWDDSAFDLYLSRDGRFVPLQIVSLGHGPVITLAGECPSACALEDE